MRLSSRDRPAARRMAMALRLQHLPAPWRQRLSWQDLAGLPQWLAQVAGSDLSSLALWCVALWHGPAWRQGSTEAAQQAARELLGVEGLQAVREHASLGRGSPRFQCNK